jgi:hypothetical protein
MAIVQAHFKNSIEKRKDQLAGQRPSTSVPQTHGASHTNTAHTENHKTPKEKEPGFRSSAQNSPPAPSDKQGEHM